MTYDDMDKHGISPCAYRFETDRDLRVEWRGLGWCIVDCGQCLNKDFEWEHEPLPSNRDNAFLDRCRFTLDQALHMAVKYLEGRKAA